jgi:hypothetical protein
MLLPIHKAVWAGGLSLCLISDFCERLAEVIGAFKFRQFSILPHKKLLLL